MTMAAIEISSTMAQRLLK